MSVRIEKESRHIYTILINLAYLYLLKSIINLAVCSILALYHQKGRRSPGVSTVFIVWWRPSRLLLVKLGWPTAFPLKQGHDK